MSDPLRPPLRPSFRPYVLEPLGIFSLLQRRLVIEPEGLRLGKRLTRWQEIGFYRCTWQLAALAQLQVVTDHAMISLNDDYREWRTGADLVLEQLHRCLPDAPQDFRPFDLDEHGLHHPIAGTLPLEELASMHLSFIAEPELTVVQRPDRDWVYCPLAEIHNPLLFLQVLRDQGVPFEVAGPVRWPDAVYDLEQLGAGAAALPRAFARTRPPRRRE